jgi:hypothetical protein
MIIIRLSTSLSTINSIQSYLMLFIVIFYNSLKKYLSINIKTIAIAKSIELVNDKCPAAVIMNRAKFKYLFFLIFSIKE